jgi:hypothetical protein
MNARDEIGRAAIQIVREISRDSKVKLGVICLTLFPSALLMWAKGLRPAWASLFPAAALLGLLAVAAFHYQARGIAKFVVCLRSLAFLIGFSASYVFLMYAIAATARPLIDDRLAAFDFRFGFQVATLVRWARGHAALNTFLDLVYLSILPQTILVLLILGLRKQSEGLDKFILRLMICALITAGLFFLFPALGPFARGDYTMDLTQARCLEHLQTLRSGARTVVSLSDAEGLIAFPSFHTIWAILIAAAYRGRRILFPVFAALNAAMVFSTMSTGWHYVADVLAGICIWGAAVAMIRLLENWVYGAGSESIGLAPSARLPQSDLA